MKDKKIDLGYNSKCLKCGKQLCGCEFRQTKTWQERFEQEYWGKFGSTKTINDIKQFISDIRKKDEEELIKMLEEFETYAYIPEFKKAIQDYYEN